MAKDIENAEVVEVKKAPTIPVVEEIHPMVNFWMNVPECVNLITRMRKDMAVGAGKGVLPDQVGMEKLIKQFGNALVKAVTPEFRK